MSGLAVSASALRALNTRMGVSAHNVANALTPGFRRSRVTFFDEAQGGVSVGGISHELADGSVAISERPLEVALAGGNFLSVETPFGTALTRAGSLHRDADGRLVTAQGYPIAGDARLPEDARDIRIFSDGSVRVTGADGREAPAGRAVVVRVGGEEGLSNLGENLLAPPPGAQDPFALSLSKGAGPALISGLRDESNVDYVRELTGQIETRVAFEANAAVLHAQDELQGDLVHLLG